MCYTYFGNRIPHKDCAYHDFGINKCIFGIYLDLLKKIAPYDLKSAVNINEIYPEKEFEQVVIYKACQLPVRGVLFFLPVANYHITKRYQGNKFFELPKIKLVITVCVKDIFKLCSGKTLPKRGTIPFVFLVVNYPDFRVLRNKPVCNFRSFIRTPVFNDCYFVIFQLQFIQNFQGVHNYLTDIFFIVISRKEYRKPYIFICYQEYISTYFLMPH